MLLLLYALFGAFLSENSTSYDLKAVEASEHAPFTSFHKLMDRSVVPLPVAKVFSLNDRNDAKVCILNNAFSNHTSVPQQCSCSFARLRSIELECANQASKATIDCSKNVCETCCLVSIASTFSKELGNLDTPVSCKIRCLNSAVVSDVTQDSEQFLSQYLRMINALYHPEVPVRKEQDKKVIPTQYHVVTLQE